MARFYSHAANRGPYNKDSEDWGTLAGAKAATYNYFCQSFTCSGQSLKGKLFATTEREIKQCPHCKSTQIYSKRVPQSGRDRDSAVITGGLSCGK